MKFSTNVWSPVRFPSAYPPGRAFSIFKEATTFTSSYWPHPVGTSSLITVKRSVFLAHASMLPVRDALPSYIEYLRSHDEHASRLKRATHCMTAWRTRRRARRRRARRRRAACASRRCDSRACAKVRRRTRGLEVVRGYGARRRALEVYLVRGEGGPARGRLPGHDTLEGRPDREYTWWKAKAMKVPQIATRARRAADAGTDIVSL
jgi:hypothetical protein